ncbi:hypothetical protein [Streptomyces sp. NPDC048357]|uniref:hypothetical protein n=1 Tax=Streptomyces sp. NPDC048357 TaxID=3154719 RepID=UPI00342A761E
MADLTRAHPVLLGPVRLETRFTATELLVRIFPDEWSVDAFEPRPTRAELSALGAYWTAVWRAAGDPGGERAAWEELTGRVQRGRAAYLLRSYVPDHPADRPSGLPADTAVLVITGPEPVPAEDRQPTVAYWSAVWRAHGDRGRLRAADIALLVAVGPRRAGAVRARTPAGVEAAPVTSGDSVAVAFLVLPQPPDSEIAPSSWTRAAKATLLPDRFRVFGYRDGRLVCEATGEPVAGPLAVSPDPGTPSDEQLRVNEGTGALRMPADLMWMTDFDTAVAAGMGVRIPLDDTIRAGLHRLVVLGLREGATAGESAAALAELITHQVQSPGGFALLPQGTPTNNTEQAPAGQDPRQEAEAARRAAYGVAAAAAPGDWTAKTDGQWFAELLGIDPAALTAAANGDRTDLRDARAANTALWPATWGNHLRTSLHPMLSEETVAQTREFFLRYVSGRGPLPVVKIGRQPYGIVVTTAFDRLAWPSPAPAVRAAHRTGLHRLLTEAAADWDAATAKVARLGTDSGDAHRQLLDILALHPSSAEFHQRYAQSVDDLFNRENLDGRGHLVVSALERLRMAEPVRALLARFGAPAGDTDLLGRLFVDGQNPLLGPLIDDGPLSETQPVRPSTTAPARNYLQWLAEHAGRDLETVRQETGFADDARPAALLYLMLRHAVLLGWVETGRRLARAKGLPVPSPADPPFVHIADDPEHPDVLLPSESRYRQLYAKAPDITGNEEPLHLFVPGALRAADPATTELAEQVEALGLLAALPTARLERVFTEHLDCAGHRLDAWRLGLATEKLVELRYGPDGTGAPRPGVHLGAYGWLEDVVPRTERPAEVAVPEQLRGVFGAQALPHDPRNGGWIHAPSPAQARTAAVLRAGYLANGGREKTGAFAVNLSSGRVRVALSLLDGLRQGQSLGAMLGRRFERGLHEGHPGVELDRFIQPLRGAFPLRAGRLSAQDAPPDEVRLVEAGNVVDGLELVRRATRSGLTSYPYGAVGLPEDVGRTEREAMDAELANLLDVHDALADLAVAESTHQTLLGNTERAAATLDAYAKEGFPPEPDVVRTPRSGTTLTHRLALQFTPGLGPDHGAGAAGRSSPRARAEPAVDDWLAGLLPDAEDVAALVTWADPVTTEQRSRVVTQADLGLQAIELLWAVRPAGEAAMSDLDDRITGAVFGSAPPRPDALPVIHYTRRVPEKTGFFELSPLIGALRSLLTTSRPLRSTDLVPGAGVTPVDPAADEAVSLPRERPAKVLESLAGLREETRAFLADLEPLYPPPPDPVRAVRAARPVGSARTEILRGIDAFLAGYAELAAGAGRFGLARSGWAELTGWRRGEFAAVLAAVAEAAARMEHSLADADVLLDRYDELPASAPEEERFGLLQQAERLIATELTSPRPERPALLRALLVSRRREFAARLKDLLAVARTTRTTLSGLLAEVSALLPLTAFDPTGLDLTPYEDRVVAYGRELLDRGQALLKEIELRAGTAGEALGVYDAAVTGPDRVRAGTDALKALLGEDVLSVPEFTPPDRLARDWRAALRDSEELIAHLRTDPPAPRGFPVEDWLHGVARVREKPRLWEKAVVLADALLGYGGLLVTREEPRLTPVQLPHRDGEHWLAMDFPKDPDRRMSLTEDKVLFTAHYAGPAAEPLPGRPEVCGLLLDEWTEVIPAERETTGIAVHYDRPDSEPPQAMLLVAPPAPDGDWTTDDLLAAVFDTFGLARARAVEPVHLEGTAYAQLLPATVMSATRKPITVSTDLAIGNLRRKAAAHD